MKEVKLKRGEGLRVITPGGCVEIVHLFSHGEDVVRTDVRLDEAPYNPDHGGRSWEMAQGDAPGVTRLIGTKKD